MIALFCLCLSLFASLFKSKSRLEAENAALRYQLIVLKRRVRGRVQLCCAFVLALLLHRGLARNHGELRRRALERLPGLGATVQVGGHYLVDQRPRRVVRRDHPMQ